MITIGQYLDFDELSECIKWLLFNHIDWSFGPTDVDKRTLKLSSKFSEGRTKYPLLTPFYNFTFENSDDAVLFKLIWG